MAFQHGSGHARHLASRSVGAHARPAESNLREYQPGGCPQSSPILRLQPRWVSPILPNPPPPTPVGVPNPPQPGGCPQSSPILRLQPRWVSPILPNPPPPTPVGVPNPPQPGGCPNPTRWVSPIPRLQSSANPVGVPNPPPPPTRWVSPILRRIPQSPPIPRQRWVSPIPRQSSANPPTPNSLRMSLSRHWYGTCGVSTALQPRAPTPTSGQTGLSPVSYNPKHADSASEPHRSRERPSGADADSSPSRPARAAVAPLRDAIDSCRRR